MYCLNGVRWARFVLTIYRWYFVCVRHFDYVIITFNLDLHILLVVQHGVNSRLLLLLFFFCHVTFLFVMIRYIALCVVRISFDCVDRVLRLLLIYVCVKHFNFVVFKSNLSFVLMTLYCTSSCYVNSIVCSCYMNSTHDLELCELNSHPRASFT